MQIRARLEMAEDATGRLLDSLAEVDDAWCRAPSLLPGWSRGHLLTHLARNADGIRGMVAGAAEGREVTMYGTGDARETDIEAGAHRSASELVDDVRQSSSALFATCLGVPDAVWEATPEWRNGRRQRLSDAPVVRVVELELHRVDLDAGYTPADWPAPHASLLVEAGLKRLGFVPDPPAVRVRVDGEDTTRGSDAPDAVEVSGSAADLVLWLTGRSDGAGLHCDGQLPTLPAAWS